MWVTGDPVTGRLGVGSEFCITGELSGDASTVGWRTTLWVAGPTREDLCHSRAHQTCGGLVSAYLSSPRPHPRTQPPRDTRGWSWPLLSLNPPPSAWHLPSLRLTLSSDPHILPSHLANSPERGTEVISSLKSPWDMLSFSSRTDHLLLCTPAFLYLS